MTTGLSTGDVTLDPVVKWSGIARFKNSCSTLVENHCSGPFPKQHKAGCYPGMSFILVSDMIIFAVILWA